LSYASSSLQMLVAKGFAESGTCQNRSK